MEVEGNTVTGSPQANRGDVPTFFSWHVAHMGDVPTFFSGAPKDRRANVCNRGDVETFYFHRGDVPTSATWKHLKTTPKRFHVAPIGTRFGRARKMFARRPDWGEIHENVGTVNRVETATKNVCTSNRKQKCLHVAQIGTPIGATWKRFLSHFLKSRRANVFGVSSNRGNVETFSRE